MQQASRPGNEMKLLRTTGQTLLTLALLTSLAACSTRTFYETTKVMAENDCRRLPPGETSSCLARVNRMSYEEYERKRSGQNP
jgi:hypothetical protein